MGMYRLLLAAHASDVQEELSLWIHKRLPNLFDLIQVDELSVTLQQAEQIRPDIVVLHTAWLERYMQEKPREALRYICPGSRIMTVSSGMREHLIMTLFGIVQELDQEKQRRLMEDEDEEEEQEQHNRRSSIMSILEQQLALRCMLEQPDPTSCEQLLHLLHPQAQSGYAITIIFPQADGISPTENHMRLTRFDLDIRLFMRLLGRCSASPMIHRYMTVFFMQEGHSSVSYEAIAHQMERLVRLFQYRYGTTLTVGIGTLVSKGTSLRLSYRQAAMAAAFGEANNQRIVIFDEVKRCAMSQQNEWLKRNTPIDFAIREDLALALHDLEARFTVQLAELQAKVQENMQQHMLSGFMSDYFNSAKVR